MTDSSIQLDTRGLNCPMPLMLLKKTLAELPAGAVVEVLVTDPHAELDFEIWCERFGHDLKPMTSHQVVGEQLFHVTKNITKK